MLMIYIAFYLNKLTKPNQCVYKTLRKKCPYWELFWAAFFPHFPKFGLNTEKYYLSVFSPNVRKCGKNADQNTSEYGHFLRS